jgi:hypothetical protein
MELVRMGCWGVVDIPPVIGSAMGVASEEKALAASPLPQPQTRRERERVSELQMLQAQLETTTRVRIRQDTMVVGSAMGVASDEKGKEVKFKEWLSALAKKTLALIANAPTSV